MKLTTKQTTEVEVEINLPYFFTSVNEVHYAVLSENLAIQVGSNSINAFSYPSAAFANHLGSTEITAEQFTAEYDKVLSKLGELKSEFFKPKQ